MFTCNSVVKLVALLFALSVAAPPRVVAQTADGGKATLRMTVSDQGGAAVASARVRITAEGGAEQTAVADESGAALFRDLAPGRYGVRVEAQGFEPLDLGELRLGAGHNERGVRLEVARISEEITVKVDEREERTDPRGNAFTNVLTEEQIAQLPDDPEELEATLRRIAGPGAVLQINGFRGGRLPPKSQIREIRFRLNPYAAENHEAGLMGVDILTKPGLNSWHGALNFGFRDEALNARNSFAPRRADEWYRRLGLALSGPLVRERTSLFLSAEGVGAVESDTIVAALPGSIFADSFARPLRTLNFSGRAEHVLTKTHTLRLEYQRNTQRRDNLGVGNFDLPERAYSISQTEHLLRASDTGMLTPRFVNEFRAQARWQERGTQSVSDETTLIVLDAFSRGGAQIHDRWRARELTLVDNVDFAVSNHMMRAGVELNAGHYYSNESRNANGTFVFASLEDFRAGRPTTFTQLVGDSTVEFTQYQLGWYWQDDMRLRKDFTLSVGLRHEFQTHLADRNNFAPRVGMAWSPFSDGRMTFRAGAGVFYDWLGTDLLGQTFRLDGRHQSEVVIVRPTFPKPFGGAELTLPPSLYRRDPAMTMPYIAQASAGVEMQLPSGMKLISTYSYQRGAHLLRARNVNAPVTGLGRPDPSAGNVIQVESSANSTYSSLNLTLSRFSKSFQFIANYSLSKATDEVDSPLSLPADNYDLRGERGPALWDARHRFFAMLNFALPKRLRLATTLNASSATPYNVTTGLDDNGDTILNDRPAGSGRNSARGAGYLDLSARLSWSFGFGRRREETGRGVNVVDTGAGSSALGAASSIPGTVNNLLKFQVYAQVNNLLNRSNLTNFTGVKSSVFFGRATAALPSRRFEAGLRFEF